MSSGLYYPPATRATTAEVCRVAEPLGDAGGVYTAHMRDEGDDILAAMDEAFLIGRHANAPVVISHHKCNGRANFGLTDRGHLRAGAFADIVIFDPDTVGDRATFDAPINRSAGIERVFVNGQESFSGGTVSSTRKGRVLRRGK